MEQDRLAAAAGGRAVVWAADLAEVVERDPEAGAV